MATFVQDTFSGTAGAALDSRTGEVGASWARPPGSGSGAAVLTAAGRLRMDAGGFSMWYASGAPASAEYDVSAGFAFVDATPGSDAALLGRQDPAAQTCYMAYLSNGAAPEFVLYKRVAGAYTELGRGAVSRTAGATIAATLRLRTASKAIVVDGADLVASGDDAVAPAGRAGLYFDGTAPADATGLHLDDFLAADPAAVVSIPVAMATYRRRRA